MEPADQAVLGTDYALAQYVFHPRSGKPKWLIGRCAVTVVWGICALCQCAANNFGGLLAIRIILGYVSRADILPGCD